MKQYTDLVQEILLKGIDKEDRTGTGIRSIFGHQMRFDLQKGFPLITVKRTWFKGVVHELLWLLSGSTNIKYLVDNDIHIWDAWADSNGELGPVYGKQWRNWNGIDQIAEVISDIKTKPDSRRHIVSAWNVGELSEMALPPCHSFFQFYVADGKLSCQLYQRSADVFLGVPFNIASYALLTHMIAQVCGLEVGEFIHTLGDAHLYHNHILQASKMIKRSHKALPKLELNKSIDNIDDFKYDDIVLTGYDPHPAIKGEVSV